MDNITGLEKDLNEKIHKLILGKEVKKEELQKSLEIFFKNKRQEDVDKLKPLNIRLFTVALEIFKTNDKLSLVNLANLDYIYSYKNKPLKYHWKSSGFNLSNDVENLKTVLSRVINNLQIDGKNAKKINEFLEQAIEMYNQKYSSDIEEIGIINSNKDSYVHLEYQVMDDDYRNERNGEFNILLVSSNKDIVDSLPNNNGTIYSNLVFKNK